ncbi:MAG: ribosome maturation factor RimM [Halomonadaceae bacterium]|nr:MAG: ribosome maturation factor RimM [Halomonadaceae bacterium]
MPQHQEETVLGRITSVFGIKGWLKVYSFTDPMTNILDYRQWVLVQDGVRRNVRLAEGKKHGKGLLVLIDGLSTPEQAQSLCGAEIRVSADALPQLPSGEYYWHQLEGLSVVTSEGVRLGVVKSLLETGANDVLVIDPDVDSVDGRRRLVPYAPGEFVTRIDLQQAQIEVDWDPEF